MYRKQFLFLFVVVALLFFNSSKVFATDSSSQGSTSVGATVGSSSFYNLNVSGYITPLANIQLLISNFPVRTVTADQNGYFYFTDVQIQGGLSSFCFDAFDPKRVGESYSCLSISPASSDVTLKNVFLPPTMGLGPTQLPFGSKLLVNGYTMPYAQVTVHLNTTNSYAVTADSKGYYSYNIGGLQPGVYNLYPTAIYNSNTSVKPLKYYQATIFSLSQTIINNTKNTLVNIGKLVITPFYQSPLGPLWATIPLVSVIGVLLSQAYPGLLLKAFSLFPLSFLKKKDKRLHHYWFVGY